MLRSFLKENTFFKFGQFRRGFKFQLKGIIPGGGLGKLQGIKEEEYFSKQDHQMLRNIQENFENSQYEYNNIGCIPSATCSKETPKEPSCCEHRYSVKHKNLLEEVYFFNEHCDNLQILKAKKNKDENDF